MWNTHLPVLYRWQELSNPCATTSLHFVQLNRALLSAGHRARRWTSEAINIHFELWQHETTVPRVPTLSLISLFGTPMGLHKNTCSCDQRKGSRIVVQYSQSLTDGSVAVRSWDDCSLSYGRSSGYAIINHVAHIDPPVMYVHMHACWDDTHRSFTVIYSYLLAVHGSRAV